MKPILKIILGIALMAGGLYGMSLDIPTNKHYFGTGVTFGIGFSLLVSGIYSIAMSKKKKR